jgi:nicotinamide mononucleotide transporter
MKKWFKKEFVENWKMFDYLFLFGLLGIQLVMTPFMVDEGMSIGWNVFVLSASFIGTLATIICSKGKISYYIFGFIQTGMFLVLNLELRLWVESAEQLYYLVTMVIGVFVWKKSVNKNNNTITPKKFTLVKLVVTIVSLVVLSVGIYYIDVALGGNAPLLDTLSLSVAVVANILCTFCYKEQWVLWFILDIVQTVMYFVVGQPIMGIMYIAWTVNCVYGWYNWNKEGKKVV